MGREVWGSSCFLLTDEMAQQSRKRRYNYICNMPSFICCGGRVQYKPRGACCGTRAYDTQKCLCCAGTVRYKPAGSPRCCGTQAYNAQSHVCCRGTIQPRPNGSPACCGTRAYDSQECLCCSGTVRYKPPGRPRCCGTQAYNAQSKICCGRTVQSSLQACCRFQRYGDFQHYMCCGGVLRRKPAGFPRCCGTYAYDYQRFTCIGGNMKRIPPGSPTNPVKWRYADILWQDGIETQLPH